MQTKQGHRSRALYFKRPIWLNFTTKPHGNTDSGTAVLSSPPPKEKGLVTPLRENSGKPYEFRFIRSDYENLGLRRNY